MIESGTYSVVKTEMNRWVIKKSSACHWYITPFGASFLYNKCMYCWKMIPIGKYYLLVWNLRKRDDQSGRYEKISSMAPDKQREISGAWISSSVSKTVRLAAGDFDGRAACLVIGMVRPFIVIGLNCQGEFSFQMAFSFCGTVGNRFGAKPDDYQRMCQDGGEIQKWLNNRMIDRGMGI